MKTWLVFFILISVMSLGCQPERKNDPFETGFEQIDRGNYTAAIEQFEKQLAQDPNNPRLKMALASAYAGRAGLQIDRFWEFYQELQGPEMTPESLASQAFYTRYLENISPIAPFLPADIRADVDQLFLSMTALSTYRDRAQVYPYVKTENRPDVEKAISLLNDENIPSERLYRALLNGALVRSELDDGFDFWTSIGNPFAELIAYPLEFQRIFCTPVTGDLTVWIDRQFQRTKTITGDLQASFPSDAEDYAAFAAPVESYQAELPRLQAKLIPAGCSQ